jgi:hypothetical protein
LCEFLFEGTGAGDAEVEDAGGEGCIGFASAKHICKVSHCACATRGDDGNADGLADGGSKLAVKTISHSIGVHGGEKDFTCAALLGLAGPLDYASASGLAASADKDLRVADGVGSFWIAAGINGDNDGLRAEAAADGVNQQRIGEGGGVEADLVRAGFEDLFRIARGADAAADAEGNK